MNVNTNPMDDYLKLIGQGILQQQLAEAQQQPPRLTEQQQRQLINQHIVMERDRRHIEQQRDAARARREQLDKDRAAHVAQVQREEAQQLEAADKEEARAEWLAAGNPAYDFTAAWPTLKLERQRARAEAYREATRRGPARNAI